MAEEVNQFTVLHDKQIPVFREAINQVVVSPADIPDRLPVNPVILQQGEIHFRINHCNPGHTADINDAIRIFRNGPDTDGFQSFIFVPLPDFPVRKQEHTGIVCSDPQPVLTVHIQAPHIRNPGRGIKALKGIAVIANQAGITADPQETFAGLGNGICLGCRQAVPVVIQDRRISFVVSERIDRELCTPVSG